LAKALEIYKIGPPTYFGNDIFLDIEGIGEVDTELRCQPNGGFEAIEMSARPSLNYGDAVKSTLRLGFVAGAAIQAYSDLPWDRALALRDRLVARVNASEGDSTQPDSAKEQILNASVSLNKTPLPAFNIEATNIPLTDE
jgi:hypothetical protein